MNDVAVVVFDEETQALAGSRAIRELERRKKLTSYADAIVTKTADGRELVCRKLRTGLMGTLMCLGVGALVGLLRGPVGIVFGAGVGSLVGASLDLIARAGIKREFLDEASPHLLPGEVGLVTEIDEKPPTPFDTRMEALGGRVSRRSSIQVEGAVGRVRGTEEAKLREPSSSCTTDASHCST